MGYYTRYELEVGDFKQSEEVFDTLENISGIDLRDADSMKWYEHELHMKNVSLLFPKLLLTLTGYGKETGDIWKYYFKNGKSQYTKANFTFDSFDEALLKDISEEI